MKHYSTHYSRRCKQAWMGNGHDQKYEASLWTFDIFLKMKFANKSLIFQLNGTKICTPKDTNILERSVSKFFKKIPLLQNYDKKLTLLGFCRLFENIDLIRKIFE